MLRAFGEAAIKADEYNLALAIADRIRRLKHYDGLRIEGLVLAKREPHSDHTGFWKRASAQLPDNSDITRKLVHAALSARRTEDAREGFERLQQQRQLQAGDADYVLGLALTDLQRNDRAAARQNIRRFLEAMREQPGYRAAARRFKRLKLASVPNRG